VRLNLHGVAWAGHPPPHEGTPLRLVTWQDLAVIVSELPSGHVLNEQDALAHLDMLCALVRDGPVVPFRFGTTAADASDIRTEVLAPGAARLRGQLDRLDGLVEVHVYLRFEEDAALRTVFEESADRRRFVAGPDLGGQIRAGEEIARRLVTWRRATSDALLAPVSEVARNEVPLAEREHTEERRAFLIPHSELEAVRTAVAELPHNLGAELVGPLPAYSFLTESTGTEANRHSAPASRWGW
jgi:hypothetical protein